MNINKITSLNISDYQNRGSHYPNSGVADSIRFYSESGGLYIIDFWFKNTDEATAMKWSQNWLAKWDSEIFAHLDTDQSKAFQAGDYEDDWVEVLLVIRAGRELTVEQYAEEFGRNPMYVRKLARSGKINARKDDNGQWIISVD